MGSSKRWGSDSWSQNTWEEQQADAQDDTVDRVDAEEVLATVHEKGESDWIESREKDDAGSDVSTAADDQSLISFLAQIGPQFDASFVSEHTGAQDYDELISFTFTRTDLDPLVQAGMKPLLVNKLSRPSSNNLAGGNRQGQCSEGKGLRKFSSCAQMFPGLFLLQTVMIEVRPRLVCGSNPGWCAITPCAKGFV